MHQSSYPKNKCQYGWITIVAAQEDNTKKLKIGTTTCNLLITSSLRLDKNPNIPDIVEMGPNTTNFVPTENTAIYLNAISINLANLLTKNESTTCINEENCLYQLRQIKSKFHCLSTYTMCRSFTSTAWNITFRSYTIWILCEYDAPQKADSQARVLSRIFQSIAYSVIKNGSTARVSVDSFKSVQDQLKENTTKDTIAQILKLEEDGFITIINNFALDGLLQSLADSMTISIKNANQNAAKQL